ncbi:MAG: hypothetical protein US49_C0014G0013 [candidate division TM6 bacterium GW2011_GWF2_37_49]|nr:MAG: hypothetical protein US49_C0014G0013 [candidate division TM6 bacterium GW2011_GWF2_37_49]
MNNRCILIIFLTIFSITTADSIFACAQHLPTDTEKMQLEATYAAATTAPESITFKFEQQFADMFRPELSVYWATQFHNDALLCKLAMSNAFQILLWGLCHEHDANFFRKIRQILFKLDKTPIAFINGHADEIVKLQEYSEELLTDLEKTRSDNDRKRLLLSTYNSAPEHQNAPLQVRMDMQYKLPYFDPVYVALDAKWTEEKRFSEPWNFLLNGMIIGVKQLQIRIVQRLNFLINKQLPVEEIVQLLYANQGNSEEIFIKNVESAMLLGV